jgi:hypothetical protein
MPDVVASISPSMSQPQNFRKHNKEFTTSWVQTTSVRAVEQMERTEKKTVDEHYREEKTTCMLPGIFYVPYIHTLQGPIPFTHMLGLCNLKYKIVLLSALCHTISFLIAISFPVLSSHIQHVSVKLLELHHDYAENTVN